MIKIAIHHAPETFSDFSRTFSMRWIEYCEKKGFPYKKVNCYDSDIIEQLHDCKALMWHWLQYDTCAIKFARQLIYSLEAAGINVFPNPNTCWHFDDKIGQKYLLESINAPLVSSYVFYEPDKALNWVNSAEFPKVFKLRGGAGSVNVRLVESRDDARRLINKAFSKGFSQFNRYSLFRDRLLVLSRDRGLNAFFGLFKGMARLLIPTAYERQVGREKGYAYFQDFIAGNDHDIRVVIIGDRAFAIKRGVRKGDFRASGSGKLDYNSASIDKRCIEIAFDVTKKLKAQCLAYDFIFEKEEPLIIEISYSFAMEAYDSCPGFWDTALRWHEGKFVAQDYMVEDLIKLASKH
ncbi:MAG: hypothetical protein RQ754_10430 [Desulfuromonadales bacterium]|nr:hypothetical protein [Desulfuromonadales bacterium]